ncbi:helix-turn-helix transcriptional regulator [Streptomyces griseus]|uniref:Helix-turn-helix transcriptional regulator n=1 Tax=Streptomyces stephensoniae TaxID=3375367 RepID=A0ABU2W4U7_9ACTN|nr:helix-turn-helix transcriptional regulator [Streptomyces griseus]MDT0492538.1 helix-turn-helix transcriptional regulator [Streptomyces griseus]
MELSQPAFAEKLRYKQPQLSKVESGAVLASEGFAEALDRVAGTPGVYGRLRAKLSKQGHPGMVRPVHHAGRDRERHHGLLLHVPDGAVADAGVCGGGLPCGPPT